jgi:hypothetical protein
MILTENEIENPTKEMKECMWQSYFIISQNRDNTTTMYKSREDSLWDNPLNNENLSKILEINRTYYIKREKTA